MTERNKKIAKCAKLGRKIDMWRFIERILRKMLSYSKMKAIRYYDSQTALLQTLDDRSSFRSYKHSI